MKRSRKIEISLILSFTIVILFSSFKNYTDSLKNIRESILRLHILANSDSESDQKMKYEIRDKILEFGGEYFYETDFSLTKQEAKNTVSLNLNAIKEISEEIVNQYGKNYKIEVSIENKYFNTRQYDNITLPAGKYDSLVVRIGEAEGQNWWCVMFPPMCVPAAEGEQELSNVLDDGQLRIVTEDVTYNIKFAVVEAVEELYNNF
jgi:stage II sporulation protein R